MGRKNRSKKRKDPGNANEFKVNPFADLDVSVPDPAPAPTPTPAPPPDTDSAALSREDRELLEAFGNAELRTTSDPFKAALSAGSSLRFSVERKGRRGKTVTAVRSFERLTVLERMELLKRIRRDLGVGGTFAEDVLELQGDQRERAAKWFARQQD